jgi:hypothetical protein
MYITVQLMKTAHVHNQFSHCHGLRRFQMPASLLDTLAHRRQARHTEVCWRGCCDHKFKQITNVIPNLLLYHPFH